MSTDWGIGCRTCVALLRPHDDDTAVHTNEYFTGEFDNCRHGFSTENLKKLIEHRELVAKTTAALGHLVTFSWGDWSGCEAQGVGEFFARHEGHNLAVMDEYGQFEGENRFK